MQQQQQQQQGWLATKGRNKETRGGPGVQQWQQGGHASAPDLGNGRERGRPLCTLGTRGMYRRRRPRSQRRRRRHDAELLADGRQSH